MQITSFTGRNAFRSVCEVGMVALLNCLAGFRVERSANLPGEMKAIMDNWNWKMKVDFTDKVGGAFTTAGGQVGGQGHVVVSLLLFMLNNRMIVAGPLYHNEVSGSIWGESGAAAITGPLDPGISDGEFDAAQRLGERIARITKKMKGS